MDLGENALTYKIKYDDDSDVLTIVVKEKGKVSHAQEVGDMILHIDENGEPLFLEILKASKIVPLMVEGLAKKEVTVA
jgi:uncharacterized protein YuzE